MPPLLVVRVLFRLFEVLGLLAWHGLVFSYAVSTKSGRIGRDLVAGRQLSLLFEDLGPCFVKIGQILSTRRDVLPEGITKPLERLREDGRPVPYGEVVSEIERALGRTIGHLFSAFDPNPIASASIAQVHKAILAEDHRAVAVKVRRPRIEKRFELDLVCFRLSMRVLSRLPQLSSVPLSSATDAIVRALKEQLDFEAEAATIEELRRKFATFNADVLIPAIVPNMSCETVLVMDFVEGLQPIDSTDLDGAVSRSALTLALRALYSMLFEIGTIHCDLHPGNLMVRGTTVVLLDWGFVCRLNSTQRNLFRDLFMAIGANDGRQCARVLRESAQQIPPGFSPERFEADIARIVSSRSGLLVRDFQVAGFVASLFAVMRTHKVIGSPDFTLAIYSLVTLEGLLKHQCPDLDFQKYALPFVSRSLLNSAFLY